jgi:hypothetical protein
MRGTNTRSRRGARLVLSLVVAVAASLGAAATGHSFAPPLVTAKPPAGKPAPARLVGLYAAHFTPKDEETSGTWHLRIGPGHHLKLWNTDDQIAHSPSFEAGPVSFRGSRMIFAKFTGEGHCNVAATATYRWTYLNGRLRFRLIGSDACQVRVITFTPHAWRRSS